MHIIPYKLSKTQCTLNKSMAPSSASDSIALLSVSSANSAAPPDQVIDVGADHAAADKLNGKETNQDGNSSNCNDHNINNSSNCKKEPVSNSTFVWKEYNNNLKKVKQIAVGTNSFYSLNWFLGFCSLTWATTVILGGMVTNIRKRDYYSVAILLVLEALRLATARFFSFFVTRHLIHGSADPTKLVYNDCRELAAKELLRSMGQIVELAVLSVSIVLPARRLRDVHYQPQDSCAHEDSSTCNFNGVLTSLQIFYAIVLANAILAAVGVIYSKTIMYALVDNTTYAMRRYYHGIVWNCIVKGLLHSTDLDIVQFAFEIQALEYKNNKRAPDVMQMYSDLMKYLYEHPHHKGFEAAKVELDSTNTFTREAAANIVGCWISLGIGGGKTLLLQEKLLSKLADTVDHEETGRAATSSFEQMATKFPRQTAEVNNSRGQRLVDILVKAIHQVVLQDKPDKGIVFIKVLVILIDSEEVGNNIMCYSESGSSTLGMLREDLIRIVKKCKFKRTQVVASYALIRLLTIKGRHEDQELCLEERAVEAITARLRSPPQPAQNNEGQKRDQNQILEAGSGCSEEAGDKIMCCSTVCGLKRTPHVVWAVICLAWKYFIMMPIKLLCYLLFIKLLSIILASISFLWRQILDFSVGKNPTPTSTGKKPEHILKNEADYMNHVIEFINRWEKSLISYRVDDQFEGIQVRDIGKENSTYVELPNWLKDPKTTTYNVAVIMVFLTLGFCSFFIFYPAFHF